MIEKLTRPLLTLALSCALISPMALAADSDVVAKVGDESITVEAMKEIITNLVQQQGQNLQPAQMAQIQQQQYQLALDRLVDIALLEDAAEEENIQVTDAEIDAEIEKIKSNLPDPSMLDQLLQRGGQTMEGLREDIRKERKLQKVIEKHVPEVDPVTEETAKAYYDENTEQFAQAEQIRASHILLKVDAEADEATANAAKEKAQEIRQEIVNDEISFEEAAKKYSEGPSAPNGGDLDFFARGRMVPEFEAVAFELEKGEVSEPVKTQFGYHLIKVTDTKKSYEDFKTDIIAFLETKEKGEKTEEYLSTLKEDAEIEVLMDEEEWKKEFNNQPQQNMQLQIPQGALDNNN